MKYLILFLTLLILSGCSHKNAFSNFEMDRDQELSIEYHKKVKLNYGDKTIGTFSSIYLNKIYPDRYNKNEYFFIYIYLKDSYNMQDYKIRLNKNNPLKIKELNYDNKFSKLTNERNRWSEYYLVSFEKTGKLLNLTLGNDQSILASLKYQKDEE